MASSSNSSDIEETKSLIKLNWYPLKIDAKTFSFKSNFTESRLELMLLDLADLKMYLLRHASQEEIMSAFREFNPSLEMPVSTIVKHLCDNFTTHSQTNEKIFSIEAAAPAAESLIINMSSKLSGVKFRWVFRFRPLNASLIRDHLILPLIFSCAEHQVREHELVKIIQAKDKELDDFRSQGVKLSRKHLHTDLFNMDAFDEHLKKEATDANAEKSLYTPLAHKINEICVSKYMSGLFKQNDDDDNKLVIVKEINEEAKNVTANPKPIEKANSASKKESRIKELESKLKDEEEKAKKALKKKKLF